MLNDMISAAQQRMQQRRQAAVQQQDEESRRVKTVNVQRLHGLLLRFMGEAFMRDVSIYYDQECNRAYACINGLTGIELEYLGSGRITVCYGDHRVPMDMNINHQRSRQEVSDELLVLLGQIMEEFLLFVEEVAMEEQVQLTIDLADYQANFIRRRIEEFTQGNIRRYGCAPQWSFEDELKLFLTMELDRAIAKETEEQDAK